jgi:hypothetical protein
LRHLHTLYPLPAPIQVNCDGEKDDYEKVNVTGKLQAWEDSHCPMESLHMNAVVVEGNIDCKGVKVTMKFKAFNIELGQKVDPVNWETVESSIAISGGLIKEFEKKITDNLKGKAAAGGKATIVFDKDFNATDFIVKVEAGAKFSGPMGGKAEVDLGNMEISMQGGFRGEGPVPDLAGRMFGK